MARGQSRGGALRVPVLRRRDRGIRISPPWSQSASRDSASGHICSCICRKTIPESRCLVPPNSRAPRHEGKAEGPHYRPRSHRVDGGIARSKYPIVPVGGGKGRSTYCGRVTHVQKAENASAHNSGLQRKCRALDFESFYTYKHTPK